MKLRNKAKRDRAIIVKVICTTSDKWLRKTLDNAGMVVGKVYHADTRPLTTEQLVSGWCSQWEIRSLSLPLTIQKSPDFVNRKGRNYYHAPGVPGLLFIDHVPRLGMRDTRRDTDWIKEKFDKRVVRRMYRQMAKYWDGGELKLARNHKR